MLIFFLYQNPYLSNGGQVFQNTYIFLSFPPSDYKDLTKIQFLDRRQSIVYRILSQKFYLIEIEYSFLAIKISSCSSSIYKEISSGNKGSPITHQQFGNICHFICCSRTMCRTLGKHLLIKFSTYTVKLIKSQWGNNDARRNRINARSSSTSFYGFRHNTFYITTFSQLVCMECIIDMLWLQNFEIQ